MKYRILKNIGVIVTLVTIVFSAAACGSTTSSTSTPKPAKKVPVKLTLSTFNTWWTTDQMKLAIKMYQDETGNTIEPQVYPDDQFITVLKAKMATGDVPDVFAYNTDVTQFGKDQLLPLQGPWVSKIDKTRSVLNKYARKEDSNIMYAAPYGPCNFQGIMYNKDVMKKAGVTLPLKTYTEFIAACEAIKKIGVTPLYLPNKDGWTAQILVYSGSMYIPIKEPTFAQNIYSNKLKPQDDPLLLDMTKKLVDLKTKGYMNADMASATMVMAEQALAEGADFSVYKTGGGSALYIPTNSKQKDAAADFINFVMSDKVIQAMFAVAPGINDLGITTKANTFDLDMQALVDNGKAKVRDIFTDAVIHVNIGSGFDGGDMGLLGQSLFAGQDPAKALTEYYLGSVKKNNVKGIPNFK